MSKRVLHANTLWRYPKYDICIFSLTTCEFHYALLGVYMLWEGWYMRWNIASRQEKEYCFSAILQQISRLHNSIIVVISPPFTIRMLEYDNMLPPPPGHHTKLFTFFVTAVRVASFFFCTEDTYFNSFTCNIHIFKNFKCFQFRKI